MSSHDQGSNAGAAYAVVCDHSPVLSAASLTTNEDEAGTMVLQATDPDGDGLAFAVARQPAMGVVGIVGSTATYIPPPDAHGTTTAVIQVSDGNTVCFAELTITVTPVEDAPVAFSQVVAGAEDTSSDILLAGSDADGDSLTYMVAAPPTRGTLTGTPPDLTYTPDADATGTDVFTFTVSDGQQTSDPATVTIVIAPVNDAPVAEDQSVTASEDTACAITLKAGDIDGDALTWSVVTPPIRGTLTGIAPALVYMPDADATGTDSFTFKVNDGMEDSRLATVSIAIVAVNDPPSVVITTPIAGIAGTEPITITIQANAADRDGTVARVEFFQGSTKLGEDATPPYACTWTAVVADAYAVTARAIDDAGAVGISDEVTVVVIPHSREVRQRVLPGLEWDCLEPAGAVVLPPAGASQVIRAPRQEDMLLVPVDPGVG